MRNSIVFFNPFDSDSLIFNLYTPAFSGMFLSAERDARTEENVEYTSGKTRIRLVKGDIARSGADAIVNAANSALQMGGGVAGAIRRAGGESIQQECDRIGGTPVGTAVITGGGRLSARHVIHAVGPRMGEGREEEKLAGATRSSLEVADRHGLASIALPAISSGIFGVPLGLVARTMVATAVEYLSTGRHSLREVMFYLFDDAALAVFEEVFEEIARKRA
ncbi:MAG TPA: macro domain-containing protein, partial [Candidatus Glassbacteria bacterium]|nr:macro domain-containing protein [Candidatus Glassbacteria bacterium]